MAKPPECKGLSWRHGFALFSLLYAGAVVFLALDNFGKVYGEYRQAKANLQPDRIEEIALQELVDQCRRQEGRRGGSRRAAPAPGVAADPCRFVPEAALAERRPEVAAQLKVEQRRFLRKLVVFAATFALFFLALPLGFLYLLLSFLVWLFRDMKFVK